MIFLTISISLIVLSIIVLIARGGPNFGIDFKGGSFIHAKFETDPEISEIRTLFKQNTDFGTVEIKRFGDQKSNEVLIGVQRNDELGQTVNKIKEVLDTKYKNKFAILREEAVGPKIGNELKWKAILSIFLSLLAIIIYIWIRFQFKFGLTAITALFHDVIITLGIFAFLNLEVSLPIVAAFLTIIGYSLNDTIVVFDRIRENLFSVRKSTVKEIINQSVNQSLSRTIVTSLTTLVAVLALYFLGVSVIKNLAFALIIGVIIGTYSSIGVASSILSIWDPESLKKQKK